MKLTLKLKLVIQFFCIAVIPIVILGTIAFMQSKDSLVTSFFQQLDSINSIKKAQVKTFFSERRGDIEVLANVPYIKQAFVEFKEAEEAAEAEGITGHNLLKYDQYVKVHNKYHPILEHYMKAYGYYDVFLMDKEEGHIVYSVTKEPDFNTHVTDIKSSLTDVWRMSVNQTKTVLSDTAPYAPSNGTPAQFISTVIKDENSKVIGVLAFQIPLDPINAIMGNRAGMGKTGESYLVGEDELMRSDSYLDPKHHSVVASFKEPGRGKVNTEASGKALKGDSGKKIITDYNGSPVLSSFDLVDLGDGVKWAILSEIDEAEALAPVSKLKIIIFTTVILIAVISSLIGLFFGARVSNPIMKIVAALTDAAGQVSSASLQLSSSSQQLSSSSSEQASSIEETSASLEEMTGIVKNNVEGAEQCVEISTSVSEASTKGNESMVQLIKSMDEITLSNTKIQELAGVINEIGEKTAVIDEIVFQTKLLSFNASVEAERAGEHGRGFAVVAQEVGNLAQMSGKAAAEISAIVKDSIKDAESIASENRKKVEIGSVIVKESAEVLQEISNSADTVVNSTGDILKSSKEQSSGIQQINMAVTQLDKATQENAATAEESASASEELSAQASRLNEMIEQLTELVTGDNVQSEVSNTRTQHETSTGVMNTNKNRNLEIVSRDKVVKTTPKIKHSIGDVEDKDSWSAL